MQRFPICLGGGFCIHTTAIRCAGGILRHFESETPSSHAKYSHKKKCCGIKGIDIQAALDDEETAKKVAQRIADYQQSSAEQAKHEEELKNNLQASADEMESLGLDDEQKLDLWQKFFKVVGDAEDGKVSAETWKLFKNAYAYEDDVASAREEGAMQGRNEKLQNKLKTSRKEGVPPTLSTSGGGSAAQQQKKPSFWDGLTK